MFANMYDMFVKNRRKEVGRYRWVIEFSFPCEHDLSTPSRTCCSCWPNMLPNMFDQHVSIIGEHELVHVCKHYGCTWTVTRPRVPRDAIQARVSRSIPDVFVTSLSFSLKVFDKYATVLSEPPNTWNSCAPQPSFLASHLM